MWSIIPVPWRITGAIEYNIWYYPDETCEQVKADFEAYVLAVCQTDEWLREHPPQFTWGLRHVTFPAFETAPDHPFIELLMQSAQTAGVHPEIKGFSAASDLAWYAQQDMPGCLFGPAALPKRIVRMNSSRSPTSRARSRFAPCNSLAGVVWKRCRGCVVGSSLALGLLHWD